MPASIVSEIIDKTKRVCYKFTVLAPQTWQDKEEKMKRIVLADEEPFVLTYLNRFITQLPNFSADQFVVHKHTNTTDAIADISGENVVLVITELNFFETGKSGADIILAAKENDPPPTVILFCNPYDRALEQQGKTATMLADYYIIKADRGSVERLRTAASAALGSALNAGTSAND